VPTVASLQEDTDPDSESDDNNQKEAADVAAALAEKEECRNLEKMLSTHEKVVVLEKGYVKLVMKIGSRASAPLWKDHHFMKPVFTKRERKSQNQIVHYALVIAVDLLFQHIVVLAD